MKALQIQRIAFFLLTIVFLTCKVYVLLVYVSIYYLSFEYLNSNKKFEEITFHKTYNWFYVAYLAFVVFVRSGLIEFSKNADYHLNTAEHLFFMFLICQTVLIYIQLFNFLSSNYLLRLVVVFIILNFIGIVNEYFQNFYQNLTIFYLEQTDIKDLVINLIGSLLFIIISLFYKLKK